MKWRNKMLYWDRIKRYINIWYKDDCYDCKTLATACLSDAPFVKVTEGRISILTLELMECRYNILHSLDKPEKEHIEYVYKIVMGTIKGYQNED